MFSANDFEDLFNFGKKKAKEKVLEITEDQYNVLKEKAEHYDELQSKYKELKARLDAIDQNNSANEKLKEKAKLADKYLESLARIQAEYENYRKITERENAKFKKYALKSVLSELLKIHDDLERALQSTDKKNINTLQNGLKMILINLKKLLENEGVKPIKAVGEVFDPTKHHVCLVEQIQDNKDIPEDTILEEMETGYYYNDAVLRPSMVKIAKIVSK